MTPLRMALVVLALAASSCPELAAQTAPGREYQIKAVFLFNFVQFVEWPQAAFSSDDAPIRIGVLGDDPFGSALDEAVRGESVRNRRLIVVRSQRVEDLEGCHLLFISKSESRRLDTILSLLGTRPVLSVSEAEGFARRGGVVAFYSDGKKVRFEINIGAARKRGLKLSSELLSLGKIVGADSLTGEP
ncbi:MAG: hypothetical protein K0R17_615 [Rariglobus sp.]|jgi:hypothetical protein|nr:hypothetical protein [Rariglobus sp.]